jgi:hypothetical protein
MQKHDNYHGDIQGMPSMMSTKLLQWDGWTCSKAVNLIRTADMTSMRFVRRRVQNIKVDKKAPEAKVNYNKYMRVDKHDKLRNSFALEKRH